MAKTPQRMKPHTAAKKLGVYLPATPQDFQEAELTREDLDALQTNPPEWLSTLRREGPHPRPTVAARLGVSISGLARGGVTEPLTSQEIRALLDEAPAWLIHERSVHSAVLAEEARLREHKNPGDRRA